MPDAPLSPTNEVKEVAEALNPQAKMEQLLRKVRMRREHALYHRGRVEKGDPEKHYVWVNIHEHRQIEFQSAGYEIVRDPKVKTQWGKPDGTHQRGDLVLYSINKDMHEAIKLDDELRALEGVEAPKHAFASMLAKLGGGQVYEPAPKR